MRAAVERGSARGRPLRPGDSHLPERGPRQPVRRTVAAGAALSRQRLFAALLVVGFANGISEKVYYAVAMDGWAAAAFNTFDVSVIVWGACLASLLLLRRTEGPQPARPLDWAVAGLATALFLVPVPSLSWLALTGVAFHVHRSAGSDDALRRAAAIAFALTIPLLWARVLFTTFSELVLALDAVLVAWVVGTVPSGNVVPFADASGFLFLNPGCSSITNLSLAILSACVFVNLYGRRWSAENILWTCTACAAVISINVTRISLIGFYPERYELIHGPVGSAVAAWGTVAVVLGICLHGIGGDAARDG